MKRKISIKTLLLAAVLLAVPYDGGNIGSLVEEEEKKDKRAVKTLAKKMGGALLNNTFEKEVAPFISFERMARTVFSKSIWDSEDTANEDRATMISYLQEELKHHFANSVDEKFKIKYGRVRLSKKDKDFALMDAEAIPKFGETLVLTLIFHRKNPVVKKQGSKWLLLDMKFENGSVTGFYCDTWKDKKEMGLASVLSAISKQMG